MAKGIIVHHSRGAYHRLSKPEWSLLVRLYANGYSSPALSRRFNIAPSNIVSGLRRRGISIRHSYPKKKLTKNDWKFIKKLYKKGNSARQIASEYGIPHSTVVRGLRRKKVHVRQRKFPLLKFTSIELAYVAGLFDGEGHVSIALNKQGRRNGSHWLSMAITNTNLPVLKYLKKRAGGHIRKGGNSPLSIKPVWAWGLTCRQAAIFLRAIFPYLRIKKERARIALRLQERIIRYSTGALLTAFEFAKRSDLKTRLRFLNGRGIHVRTPEQERKAYDYLAQFK